MCLGNPMTDDTVRGVLRLRAYDRPEKYVPASSGEYKIPRHERHQVQGVKPQLLEFTIRCSSCLRLGFLSPDDR